MKFALGWNWPTGQPWLRKIFLRWKPTQFPEAACLGGGLSARTRTRSIGVEVNEITLVNVCTTGRAFQPQRRVQLTLVFGEEFLQRFLSFDFLSQNTLRSNFPNVGGSEVNAVTEAILQLGQFDSLGINGGNATWRRRRCKSTLSFPTIS